MYLSEQIRPCDKLASNQPASTSTISFRCITRGKSSDCKMLVSTVFVAFATLVQSVSSTVRDAQFARAANLVYSDHLLFDSPARSKLSCLELCAVTRCCVRFTYTGRRGTPGRCRGHSVQLLPSDAGAITPGATNYVWKDLREISGEVKSYFSLLWGRGGGET